jgi:DNA invertase Pin-like site-specific DNA recombinase
MKTAIYARYSSEQQRETSIEDQVRRCGELAQRHGLEPSLELTFSDAALSGTAKDLSKRAGYQQLLIAWDNRAFDTLLTDELSRLARDGVELALLQRRLQNTPVRLITADGIDTAQANWELLLGLQSIVSQQSVRDTQHRVVRGMIGQLERGFMVATPPFGYQLDRKFDAAGNRIGTHWRIDDEEAAIVREVYTMRRNGASLNTIAETLNRRCVPTPRAPRKTVGYWRPGMLFKLLGNPIYRAEFVWNDSVFIRAKAKKTGRPLKIRHFARPLLRIVDDTTWHDCNRGTHSRTGFGGGRHALAGLIECGACGATLTVSSGKTPSLYCAQCSQATRVSAPGATRYTGSVSMSGIKVMLLTALQELLSPAMVADFKERLRQRLGGGAEEELKRVRHQHDLARKASERLARLLASIDADDPILETEYRQKQTELRELADQVVQLEARREISQKAAMEKQLSIDPTTLLESLFKAGQPAEKVRSILARLLPKILFQGKMDRTTAVFELSYSAGAAAALASDTAKLDDEPLIRRVQLTSGAKRPTEWNVAWL